MNILVWLLPIFSVQFVSYAQRKHLKFIPGIERSSLYILWRIINSIENVQCSLNARNPHNNKKNCIRFTWISSLLIWIDFVFYEKELKNNFFYGKIPDFYAILVGNTSRILCVPCEWFQFNPINGPIPIDLLHAHLYTTKFSNYNMPCVCVCINISFISKTNQIEMGFWCAFIQLDIAVLVRLIYGALCICVFMHNTRKNGINISIRPSKLK